MACWRGAGRAARWAEIQHYEIGEKPARPDTLTASYADGVLTVNVTVGGETLTLTSAVTLPEGEGPFQAVMVNGLGTNGWDWVRLGSYVLPAGEHTVTIAYRENGAALDKLSISDHAFAPEGMGEEAENACDPSATGVGEVMDVPARHELGQNYPNPFNPSTTIRYALPEAASVRVIVYDALGREVRPLVDGLQGAGTHEVIFAGAASPAACVSTGWRRTPSRTCAAWC